MVGMAFAIAHRLVGSAFSGWKLVGWDESCGSIGKAFGSDEQPLFRLMPVNQLIFCQPRIDIQSGILKIGDVDDICHKNSLLIIIYFSRLAGSRMVTSVPQPGELS